MSGQLSGTVALVTGGGQGIGRAIARAFAMQGATVVVATRSAGPGEETVRDITGAGGKAVLELVDVASRDAVFALLEKVGRDHGGLDILVHNAGAWPFAQIASLSEEDLDHTLTLNLKAGFWLVQAALPLLEKSPRARILFTSSVSGNHAYAVGLSHYSASKAGVNGLVRNLALELAPKAITVNAVEPGFVVTERMSTPEMSGFASAMAPRIPMGRTGRPEDIAHAMLYFASEGAAYVTGQSIVVDGGVTLTNNLAVEQLGG